MTKRNIQMVMAVADNGVIGCNGGMPWELFPRDMAHFRKLTLGKTVLMGKKTHRSIGRLLPDRHNVVLSRTAVDVCEGAEVFDSVDEAIIKYPDCVVIGGGLICEYMLRHGLIDVAHITHVHIIAEGDVLLDTSLLPPMQEESRVFWPADESNPYPHSFITYSKEL